VTAFMFLKKEVSRACWDFARHEDKLQVYPNQI
jgi:hypothetical protein